MSEYDINSTNCFNYNHNCSCSYCSSYNNDLRNNKQIQIIKLPNNKYWQTQLPVKEIKLTKKQANNIVVQNQNNISAYLILPFQRFNENQFWIELKNSTYTLEELLNVIYEFYNCKNLTLDDLEKLNSNDVYDYINNAKNKLINNPDSIVHPIEIMGDKRYFEGIIVNDNAHNIVLYYLRLGS